MWTRSIARRELAGGCLIPGVRDFEAKDKRWSTAREHKERTFRQLGTRRAASKRVVPSMTSMARESTKSCTVVDSHSPVNRPARTPSATAPKSGSAIRSGCRRWPFRPVPDDLYLVTTDEPLSMHDDQIDISTDDVRHMIDAQFPHWRGEPIRKLDTSGTVNAIFRIGDSLAARFPLRPSGAQAQQGYLEREFDAAMELVEISPFPVPRPVALGKPSGVFPMPWSVQTWLDGTLATGTNVAHADSLAYDLALLIKAMRAADTRRRTFEGHHRGGELARHDEWTEKCFQRSEHLFHVPTLRKLWSRMRTLPRPDADVMSHGDLQPANLLVEGDRLRGVLDTGGFAAADPALDLVCAWHLLDTGPREVLRAELGCSDIEWRRGRAWAFAQAIGLGWYYEQTNPLLHQTGLTTIGRIVDDRTSCSVAPNC